MALKKGVSELSTYLLVGGKQVLSTSWKYAKVELRPPSPSDVGQAVAKYNQMFAAAKNGSWKNLSVKEAGLNALVTAEVICWFFIGECIGKGSLIGYKHVPGAFIEH